MSRETSSNPLRSRRLFDAARIQVAKSKNGKIQNAANTSPSKADKAPMSPEAKGLENWHLDTTWKLKTE